MSDSNKRWLGYVILILAIVLAGVLGVQYPIPAPPDNTLGGLLEPAPSVRGSGYFARFNQPVQFKQTLVVDGAATLSGALSVAGATTLSGAVTHAGTMNMANYAISNVGAAGTDFSGTGGLTLADGVTVTAGGLLVTAGGATITAGGLDMTSDAISNIGAAGTDFSGTGGLTLADALVVTAGGATITAGGLDMTGDAILNIGAAGTDFSASGGLTLADALVITTGGASITAGGLDMTADAITNIGHSGTDFNDTGGLTANGGFTGTINTAAQPSITSVGTLSALNVTGTGITGTLNTAAQPSITSVGTLSALNVTGTGITGTVNTATQSSITSIGTAGADLTLTGTLINPPSGVVTLGNNFNFVPTATVQLVLAAGSIGGVVDPTGCVAGQFVYIVNTVAQNIVFTDTGTLMLSGDLTLTQYDMLPLLCDGTNWLQISAPTAN